MTLTVAIPCHNDLRALCALLRRLHEIGLGARIVVVDDGSDVPIDALTLLQAGHLPPEHLVLVRHDSPLGPGAARNRALRHVATEHLLYLDADDLPTRELFDLLQDLEGKAFDFCMFQHHDTRVEDDLAWGMPGHDLELWQAAGVLPGALRPVDAAAGAALAQTANYPWNKIYRVDFLRAHGIGCSDILVHEDIALHWRCFLYAQNILCSDRIGVIHWIDREGNRLTNRRGPERLELFGPLHALAAEIRTQKGGHYGAPFACFILGLFDWILENLEDAYHSDFREKVRRFIEAELAGCENLPER